MKEYYFQVIGKKPDKDNATYRSRIKATGVYEAKNKYKALYPEHKIISCVRQQECEPVETKQAGFSLGGSLLGLAAAAAVGFGAKILSDKFKDNSDKEAQASSGNRFSNFK